MTLTETLKSPIINKSAIAILLWPDKPKKNATVLFHNKLNLIQGNKFNEQEIERITEILEEIRLVN